MIEMIVFEECLDQVAVLADLQLAAFLRKCIYKIWEMGSGCLILRLLGVFFVHPESLLTTFIMFSNTEHVKNIVFHL